MVVVGNVDNEAKQLTIGNNVVESVNSSYIWVHKYTGNGENSMDIRRIIMMVKISIKSLENMEKAITLDKVQKCHGNSNLSASTLFFKIMDAESNRLEGH